MNFGQTFTGFLGSNLHCGGGLVLFTGTKVWFKSVGEMNSNEIEVIAYASIDVQGNTTYEVITPLMPHVMTNVGVIAPPSPPPSPRGNSPFPLRF